MRYAHANGASFFFMVLSVHMERNDVEGSTDFHELIGMLLFFTIILTAFMGYLLPWG
jgi:quinol-cytochrome oxidoreductase complex cytochrome b subunit